MRSITYGEKKNLSAIFHTHTKNTHTQKVYISDLLLNRNRIKITNNAHLDVSTVAAAPATPTCTHTHIHTMLLVKSNFTQSIEVSIRCKH